MCRRQVERRTSLTRHKPLVAEQTPTPDATEKIDRFLAAERPDPPCLVVDLDVVRTKYAALRALFPDATLYYAVNANPAAGVLATLDLLGAKSDLASEGEIDRCLVLGIGADRFSLRKHDQAEQRNRPRLQEWCRSLRVRCKLRIRRVWRT